MERKCSKCTGEMIKSYIEKDFSFKDKDGACGGCKTEKFMCIECGYIEEYGINFKSKLPKKQ